MLATNDGTNAAGGLIILAGFLFVVAGFWPGVESKSSLIQKIPTLHGFGRRVGAILFGLVVIVGGALIAALPGPSQGTAQPPTPTTPTTPPGPQNAFEKNTLYRLRGSPGNLIPFQAVDVTQLQQYHDPTALWIDFETGQPVENPAIPISPELPAAIAYFKDDPQKMIAWMDHHLEKA
jgi:hypothetical protein